MIGIKVLGIKTLGIILGLCGMLNQDRTGLAEYESVRR